MIGGELEHTVNMGADPYGNLRRLDNALERIPLKIANVVARLENVHQQITAAELELKKPFPQETALSQKNARLIELNATLNLEMSPDQPTDKNAEGPEYEP